MLLSQAEHAKAEADFAAESAAKSLDRVAALDDTAKHDRGEAGNALRVLAETEYSFRHAESVLGKEHLETDEVKLRILQASRNSWYV